MIKPDTPPDNVVCVVESNPERPRRRIRRRLPEVEAQTLAREIVLYNMLGRATLSLKGSASNWTLSPLYWRYVARWRRLRSVR